MRYVGCCFLLALVSIAHGQLGEVRYGWSFQGTPYQGASVIDIPPNLTDPREINFAPPAYPFGSASGHVQRGRVRVSAFAKSDATWNTSRVISAGNSIETVVFDVPCYPELLGTVGTLRLRSPILSFTVGATQTVPPPTSFISHAASVEVTVLVNGNVAYNQGAVVFSHGPADLYIGSNAVFDAPIVFGQPVTIQVTASADCQGGGDPDLGTAHATAEIIWQGIDSIRDRNDNLLLLGNCCTTVICNPFISPPACPGDTNNDGHTDAADLSVLLASFGTMTAPYSGANFNDDVFVNGADLSILLSNFGCDVTP